MQQDFVPLAEIQLFSLSPDKVGFETLISSIDRLLEMAMSRVTEKAGDEEYRRGLLMAAVAIVKETTAPVEAPIVKAPPKLKDSHNPPSKSPEKVT